MALVIILLCYLLLGLCFIKSAGEHPEGIAVVYFRLNTPAPFISSVICEDAERGGLLERAMPVAKKVLEKKIVVLPYLPGPCLLASNIKGTQNAKGSTMANQSSGSVYHNAAVKIEHYSRSTMITYFFIGHSNMSGYCAQMDSMPMPNVWLYNTSKGFYHGTDKDMSNNSGSPVMPFLKRMALLYPDHHFCGVKHTINGITIEDFTANGNDRFLIDKINTLKQKSTIGGVLMMFGFDEGESKRKVREIDANLKRLIDKVRMVSGNPTLPFIFGRYEENGDRNSYTSYHRYDNILIKKINTIETMDPYLKLTPIRPISKSCFCDDHHYNADGYQIWADDAAAIIQMNKLDFWNR